MHVIPYDIELKDAGSARQDLMSAVEAHSKGRFALEISGGEPSPVALQLGFATIKELQARGIAPKLGATLEAHLQKQSEITFSDGRVTQ